MCDDAVWIYSLFMLMMDSDNDDDDNDGDRDVDEDNDGDGNGDDGDVDKMDTCRKLKYHLPSYHHYLLLISFLNVGNQYISSFGIKSSLDKDITSIVDIKMPESRSIDRESNNSRIDSVHGSSAVTSNKKRISIEERLKKYDSIGVPTSTSSTSSSSSTAKTIP